MNCIKILRRFSEIPSQYIKQDSHELEPLLNVWQKKFRQIGIEKTLLEPKKIIVEAKRLRTLDDTLKSMQSKNECGAAILQREEFPDIDFVLDSKQVYSLRKRKDQILNSLYIKVDGEEIRCTFKGLHEANQGWIAWAQFNRYIVGRPNLIYLPIIIKHGFDNKYLNKSVDYEKRTDGVWVNCYNDIYPAKFELDPIHLSPIRGYKIGDLQNALPDGIELHKRYKTKLNENILILNPDREKQVEEELRAEALRKRMESGLDIVEDEFEVEEEDQKKKSTKEKKIRKSRSLKKNMAEVASKVKEDIAASVARQK